MKIGLVGFGGSGKTTVFNTMTGLDVPVGPKRIQPEIATLMAEAERHTNVHFLGLKPVQEYVTYPGNFDTCIMPYQVNGYTRYIYPLKLHEYLATGHPVVSAPIEAVREFSDVVRSADGLDDWSAAIAESLEPGARSPERREARQVVAREHDWARIASRVADEVLAALP